MDTPKNIQIRILIMSIALLGGLGFFGYLMFNVIIANDNEQRIEQLHKVKFPVLDELSKLKRDVAAVHDAFSTALALENYFLLDETDETTQVFSERILSIQAYDPTTAALTLPIQNGFDHYYNEAKSVAKVLIQYPDKTREYEQKLIEINQLRVDLINQIDLALTQRNREYERDLANTNENIRKANTLGAVLGTLLIIGLIILAWAISVVVLNAINKSDKLKEIFLATMSHELRTPINGISGAISLLKDTKLTDEQHQLLDACRVSELSIATSIDDILEFTGMMSKNIKIAQAPLSVYSIIHHTVDLFKNEYETKGLTIQVEAPTTTEEYFLGDKNRLGHALRHLIGNAVKFSNQGLIYISVEHELVDAINQQEMISISISDEGPGIPESKLKQVLTPFSQIDGSFSRKHQGMGIGVSICNAIAKAMGGELILMNKSSGGLTAIFRFCAEKSFHSVPDDQHHATPPVEKKTSDIKVLVVEDNEVNQLVIKGILDKFGYQSDSAMNGQEAVHKVEDNAYDIILMDCQMPIMDGFEATRQIRLNTEDKKHIPIIAVTANAMEGDKERCLDCGMDDYLKKPISLDRLGAAIQTQLRKDHGV